MSKNKQLHYVKNNEIDFIKWDKCIENANNSRIYATSWLLDRTASNWDALVWNDYEYVFPLVWRKKWGIKYLYQPTYCQQLGIFPKAPAAIQKEFAKAVAYHFKFAQIQVNPDTDSAVFSDFIIKPRTNLVLPLMGNFQTLQENYSKHTKRNLKKAQQSGIKVNEGINPEAFLNNKKTVSSQKGIAPDLSSLKKIIPASILNGNGVIFGAYTQENELCAAAYLLRSAKRIIYLNAFSNEEGKKTRAMYLVVNEIINKFSSRLLLLDFEGSEVEGVARFYRGFGALEETYYQLKINQLPFPLRYFKQ